MIFPLWYFHYSILSRLVKGVLKKILILFEIITFYCKYFTKLSKNGSYRTWEKVGIFFCGRGEGNRLTKGAGYGIFIKGQKGAAGVPREREQCTCGRILSDMRR